MQEKAFSGKAKIFMNGRSQAVRLPAECRFDADEVTIHKLGDHVVLSPKSNSWDAFFARPILPKDEFIPEVEELGYEKRRSFD
jgi:antitoxin VapB